MMLRNTVAVASGFMLAAIASTQAATPEQMGKAGKRTNYGTLHMQTRLGTIRSIDGEGRFEMTFTGSLLVKS